MTTTKSASAVLDKPKTAAPQQWPRIYAGPSLPRAGLSQYAVFADGFPPYVEKLLNKHPKLKELMVPTSKIQKARQDIARKGTRLNSLAEEIVTEFKGV